MYITVSPELDDVMPHINNPVSRMLKASGEVIYSTRMYPVHGDPVHADEEIAFWNKMRDYGAGDIFVRFHMGLQRTPVENNNLCIQGKADCVCRSQH